MAFRKYQKVEQQEVLSEDEHKTVEAHLSKVGKTSAADLTDAEREELSESLEDSR